MMNTKNLNGGLNTPAIVISRKKYKLHSLFTFITPRLGLIRASFSHKRLQTLRNSSYLRPFSAMYITVVPDGDYVKVSQIDGSYVVESLDVNLENIAYAAVGSELIQELFALYDVDRAVFDTVVHYSKQIRHRNVRLATIILGWQLLSLAGLVPKGALLQKADESEAFWRELSYIIEKQPSIAIRDILGQVISYQWGEEEMLSFNGATWRDLERYLFQFATKEIGKELQSVKFLLTL